MVQEKNGILRGSGLWKFPTGVVDQVTSIPKNVKEILTEMQQSYFSTDLLVVQGEDIAAGAIREVKEETGVCISYCNFQLCQIKSRCIDSLVFCLLFGRSTLNLLKFLHSGMMVQVSPLFFLIISALKEYNYALASDV